MHRAEAFYLNRGEGQRLCVYHAPERQSALSAVVFVHAFGEEMNKSRRMAAQQARRLAMAGHAVLQIDLKGCGDSSGEFSDATWDEWVNDVLAAHAWLRERTQAPAWLWGHRAGCLLACEAAKRLDEPCNLLFWQAPVSGQLLVQQFLRLKAAGNLADGQGKQVLETLRTQLAAGLTVEIGGYETAADLLNPMAQALLTPPDRKARLEWLEVSTRPEASLSPVGTKALDQWRTAGWQVNGQVVAGPAFWQTTEIEDAPALFDATVAALATSGTSANESPKVEHEASA
jgi:exosortase A-associated hydrolase 2